MKRIIFTITLVLVVSVLQGCLLTRLHETQKQVCNRKTRLEMTHDGVAIVFHQPLLTRDDIIAILGAKSDTVSDTTDLLYIARNKNDAAYSFPVIFQFSGSGEQYMLTKMSIGKRFQDVLPEQLLHKIFDAGCSAKRNGLGIEVDLDGVPKDKLPNAEKIKALLGPPALTAGTTTYNYELNDTDMAEIVISYDEEPGRMSNAAVSFKRYSLVFDFNKGVAIGRLKNFSDAVRLGFKP